MIYIILNDMIFLDQGYGTIYGKIRVINIMLFLRGGLKWVGVIRASDPPVPCGHKVFFLSCCSNVSIRILNGDG